MTRMGRILLRHKGFTEGQKGRIRGWGGSPTHCQKAWEGRVERCDFSIGPEILPILVSSPSTVEHEHEKARSFCHSRKARSRGRHQEASPLRPEVGQPFLITAGAA